MAHEQLFQIGVKALIRNGQNEILMVQIPAWSGNPEHWDFPGGRMDPGEDLLDTLQRELHEEIGVGYTGTPRQLLTFLTPITIPVDDTLRVPLVFVVYETSIPNDATITLDPNSHELGYEWVPAAQAAERMAVKFPQEFCDRIAGDGRA